MDIKSLFGLPAHPLLVHVPIVLIPLTALGAITMVWASWRHRIGWIVVGLSFVSLVFVQLAIGSGQQLEEHVRESATVSQHAELADQLRPLALLLFLVLLALMLLDWWRSRHPVPADDGMSRLLAARWLAVSLSVAMIVVAGLTTFWLGRTGHTGAKATWEKTQLRIDNGSGEGGEGQEGARSR
jgi:hypothetical protein